MTDLRRDMHKGRNKGLKKGLKKGLNKDLHRDLHAGAPHGTPAGRPARVAHRRRARALPTLLAAAAAAALVGTGAATVPASAASPGTTPAAAASLLCPTANLCLYVGGIGIPEPLQIPQCRGRDFTPPFPARKVENNTQRIAHLSTPMGTVLLKPGQTMDFRPDLQIASARTVC
ncbi:hypothetical protein V7793_00450 [Streptomyces sp. KLMMK]|uniref:hypothetical protein n=1 Tax=Streptomyces sp. KLMMK TaxID=3109353 RepID=UPI002FFE37F1